MGTTFANPRRVRALGLAVLAVLALTLAGCFGVDPQSGPGSGTGTLSAVRTGDDGTFDRVVFQFTGTTLPGWSVRYAAPPFTQDGSGATVPVSGHAFLKVRLQPADAHTAYTGGFRLPGNGTANVTEVVGTGDFEGVVGWVIGLNDLRDFQVTELHSPERLVIDIQH